MKERCMKSAQDTEKATTERPKLLIETRENEMQTQNLFIFLAYR